MKTLVFCTSYVQQLKEWEGRYSRWLKAVMSGGLAYDQILVVDDGSLVMPRWPEAEIINEQNARTPVTAISQAKVVLYHFEKNLGRPSVFDFPGWYRSFAFAAQYAEAHGFEKIIHIESDAFLTSAEIVEYFNDINEGWVALFCPKYDFPELALQVAAGSQVAQFAAWSRLPYSRLIGQCHEIAVPYTKIEKNFKGDRYGEHQTFVPADADYVAQTQQNREAGYYWWMKELRHAHTGADPEAASDITIEFDMEKGGAAPFTYDGWSHPEPFLRWMINQESSLFLPPLPESKAAELRLHVLPHVWPGKLKNQQLKLAINGIPVLDTTVGHESHLVCQLPAGTLRANAKNKLVFQHPNAATPKAVSGAPDDRVLAVAMVKLDLVFHR